jgi:hypothetical protein
MGIGSPRANSRTRWTTTRNLKGLVRRHVRQQKGALNCGQCCVAMLLDLEDDIELSRARLTHGLIRELLEVGGIAGDKTARRPSEFCLQFVTYADDSTHWVIRHKDRIFDPLMDGPMRLAQWERRSAVRRHGARVTSYIHLAIRKGDRRVES